MQRGDPVPCATFPRSKALANFRTMLSLAKIVPDTNYQTHDRSYDLGMIAGSTDSTDTGLSPPESYDSPNPEAQNGAMLESLLATS